MHACQHLHVSANTASLSEWLFIRIRANCQDGKLQIMTSDQEEKNTGETPTAEGKTEVDGAEIKREILKKEILAKSTSLVALLPSVSMETVAESEV